MPFILEAAPRLSGNGIDAFFQSRICVLNIPFRRNLKDPDYYKQQIDSVIMSLETSPVEFVIFAGSTSVYPASMRSAKENTAITPDNPRAETLMNVERALLANQNFQTTVLRFSGLYGGSRRIGQLLAGREGLAEGDSPVNLVHLDDCVAIMTQVIQRDIRGEIINVTSDGHPTRREIYTRAAIHYGLKPPRFTEQPATRFKIVSNTKLKSILDYTFLHPDPLDF
jgi:nucleoside-diphosphate-sugar epimerase